MFGSEPPTMSRYFLLCPKKNFIFYNTCESNWIFTVVNVSVRFFLQKMKKMHTEASNYFLSFCAIFLFFMGVNRMINNLMNKSTANSA